MCVCVCVCVWRERGNIYFCFSSNVPHFRVKLTKVGG